MMEIYFFARGHVNMLIEGVEHRSPEKSCLIIEPGDVRTFVDSSPNHYNFLTQKPGPRGEGDNVLARCIHLCYRNAYYSLPPQSTVAITTGEYPLPYTTDEIKAVTFVRGAIHSPHDVRHFMDIGRPEYTVTATINSKEIARSNRALKVKEVGRGVYDPVLYFLREDVDRSSLRGVYDPVLYFLREDVDMSSLEATDKTTHCPLKGHTTYFDLKMDGDSHNNVAWSYTDTIADAEVLKDLIAFDNSRVQVIEHITG